MAKHRFRPYIRSIDTTSLTGLGVCHMIVFHVQSIVVTLSTLLELCVFTPLALLVQ